MPLYSAIPAAALVNEVGWYALAFALDSGQFYPFVVRVQTLVYNTIGRLVSRLNRVIDSAAHANGAVQLAWEETSGFLDCACPYLDTAVEPNHVLANQPLTYPGGSGLFTADSNCFPHPTDRGQAMIAQSIVAALPPS